MPLPLCQPVCLLIPAAYSTGFRQTQRGGEKEDMIWREIYRDKMKREEGKKERTKARYQRE